ncbi:MAG TPA: transglutaminase domain-containing protein [Myxococcales bacterium LLY-WYZ-16_1]|nr:transglutaminase domain-containing protein [Myxococcales bacterium LLY-WYZ-16_1]
MGSNGMVAVKGLLGAGLRGCVLAAAFALFAASVSVTSGVVAVAIGAVAGSVWAHAGLRLWALRPWVVAVAAAVGALSVHAAVTVLGAWSLLADGLGPAATIGLLEGLRGFAWGLGAAAILRTGATVSPWGRLIEAAVVVASLASILASHRDGMIARPLEISDWFWSRGIDPVLAFLAVGSAASLLVAALWLRRRTVAGSAGALGSFVLLAGAVGLWLHAQPLPTAEELRGTGGQTPASERSGSGESSDTASERPPPEEPPPPDPSGGERVPVAVVVLHRDVMPWGGYFYFRTAAFSQFNGVRLVEATRDGVDRDAPRSFPIGGPIDFEPAPEHPTRTDVATDVALLTDHRRPFALIDPLRLEARTNPSPARFTRAYHAVSRLLEGPTEALFGHEPGRDEWGADIWHHYTELPRDPRYLELATRLASTLTSEYADDPFAKALAFKQYLEKTSIYSFEKRYGDAEDPTGEFLFSEDKVGYCVHLAHSMALLLRAVGVPSRVSVGYAVDARQRGRGSSLLVTNSDAHAWAEVYLDGVGWVPIEVVPERTDVEPAPFQAEDLQQLLGEMAREEGRTERVAKSPVDWSALRRTLDQLPWLLLALWGVLTGRRWLRRLRPQWSAPERRVRHAYVALLDELAAGGTVRRQGESRERFARRVGAEVPAFERLTEAYLASVLGPPERSGRTRVRSGPGGLRLWRDGLVEAGRRLPVWRRVLAWLHPVPYWRVR